MAAVTTAATPPTETEFSATTEEKWSPVMVTTSPACPVVGLTLAMMGVALEANAKFAVGKSTPFDVTATLTSPAAWADVRHSMVVAVSDVTVQRSLSMATVEGSVKPKPVMVRRVPP